MPHLTPLAPLDTAPLFPPLHTELVRLLRALDDTDWERPTVARAWRVRDVAAHLLDGDLRTLAAHRDGHALAPDGAVSSYEDVVALIQRLNETGVSYGARLSPRLLTDLLRVTGGWMSTFVASLDPDAPALFPVAWAGESQSDNRFDTAREYTERWHHQMQIRSALGRRGGGEVLLEPPFLEPLLQTAVRVLPHAYRDVPAADGTTVVLQVAGASRLVWTLKQTGGSWRLYQGQGAHPTATVEGTPDAIWRLFFNALSPSDMRGLLVVDGDSGLAVPLLRARSVMV